LNEGSHDVKKEAEWEREREFLESQLTFAKSQIEENKKIHDTLILALDKGMKSSDRNTQSQHNNTIAQTNQVFIIFFIQN
jgi:hypothetical protein